MKKNDEIKKVETQKEANEKKELECNVNKISETVLDVLMQLHTSKKIIDVQIKVEA